MDSRYAGSFENIIIDRIRERCPSLKKVDDKVELDESKGNNGFVGHFVFDLIFKGVESQRSGGL